MRFKVTIIYSFCSFSEGQLFFGFKYLEKYRKNKDLASAYLKHCFFVKFLICPIALLPHDTTKHWNCYTRSEKRHSWPVMFWVLVQPEPEESKGSSSAEM